MRGVLGSVLLVLACSAAASEPFAPSFALTRVDSLAVSPDTVAAAFGDEVILVASCYNQNDNPVKCRGGVTWTVRDTTKVRRIATKAESVYIQVRDTGVTYVVARDASARGTDSTKVHGTSTAPAPIAPTLPPPAPILASITLTPDSAALLESQTQQYTTVALSNQGTVMSPTISWAQTGGSIDGSGLYTAGSSAGTYRVIASSGGVADTAILTIDTIPTPPGPGTGILARMADSVVETISVQTHLDYNVYSSNYSSIVKPKLLELGVRHIRQQMTAQSAVWTKFQDLHTDGGITLTGGCWPIGTDYTHASHCVSRATSIGASVIDALDGWNEVDGGKIGSAWATPWVTWQSTMFAAWNASAFAAKPVLGNSLAHASSADQVAGHSSILDYGNLHSYPGGQSVPSGPLSTWVSQWNKIDGGKPDYVTETGYHTCPTCTNGVGVSLEAQGKYLPRLVMEYFDRGIVRTNLYELLDEGVSSTDREMNWGLVKNNGTAKPSFTAIKNLITLLGDPGVTFTPGRLDYTLTGALSTTHSVLLQKRDGVFYLVLWQEVSSYNTSTETNTSPAADAVTLSFGTAPSAIAVYKPSIGTSPLITTSGGPVALQVPDELLIVKVTP